MKNPTQKLNLAGTVPALTELIPHVFFNLDEVRQSRRIGCFRCGYIFLYDGTEETEPFYFGHTVQCPVCESFSLLGDASGFSIHAPFLLELQRRYRDMPPLEWAPDFSEEKLLQYAYSHALENLAERSEFSCFSCGFAGVIEPDRSLCYGKTIHCPDCSEPALIPRMDFPTLYRLWNLFRFRSAGFRQYAGSEEDWLYREYCWEKNK